MQPRKAHPAHPLSLYPFAELSQPCFRWLSPTTVQLAAQPDRLDAPTETSCFPKTSLDAFPQNLTTRAAPQDPRRSAALSWRQALLSELDDLATARERGPVSCPQETLRFCCLFFLWPKKPFRSLANLDALGLHPESSSGIGGRDDDGLRARWRNLPAKAFSRPPVFGGVLPHLLVLGLCRFSALFSSFDLGGQLVDFFLDAVLCVAEQRNG